MAIVSDGDKMNNVLTAEAWNDADQAYAVRVIMPLIGQVASFEKAKVGNKGKTTVFHTKRIKMCFDKNTDVKKRPDDKKFPHALPLLHFQDIPNMHTMCTISVQACVQEAGVPVPRPVDGGQKMVTNLKVALGDKEIEAAFWGDEHHGPWLSHGSSLLPVSRGQRMVKRKDCDGSAKGKALRSTRSIW